ncbi:FAD-dependent oxidoreductase [Infirmifilum sp. NZ]|uniref:FAD-dependent oxidoreductase n=1 Tax=Infirmifilum sp. NZ TaxID=2926850 RepID=UPI0027A5AE90|nr:FAD-dependent oxidoreductase [Infirmifilum sp. NZ]UNQ73372.1 FAD-dependent oxidoreductase [Infirmifilum sp. NZ]
MSIKFAPCKSTGPRTGKRVAIVGAGPAGLAAAGVLCCLGHRVDVFDKLPEPGGMLIFAIPEFRIPKSSVRESVRELAGLGVGFHTNTEVGRDVQLRELLEDFDAVLLATGTWQGRRLEVPGEDKEGVYNALDWITQYMIAKNGYQAVEPPPLTGKVAVVGTGLTAVDIAEVAVKEYGANIVMLYRRPMSVAPAKHMLRHLESLGVEFVENVVPVEILGDWRAERVRLVRVKPTTDRKAPTEIIPGSEFELDFNALVVAVGLKPTPPESVKSLGVELNKDGSIKVAENFATSVERLFAAGDVAHGPSNIGLAMRSGKQAAKSIDEYLKAK